MYQISHQKSDGTFVNDAARELHVRFFLHSIYFVLIMVNYLICIFFCFQEKLHNELQSYSENEAFTRVCGKEHPGYVRGMGLGVRPSQISGSSTQSTTSTTSFESSQKMQQMQAEIDLLKLKAAEIDTLKAKAAEVDILKEQIAFLM